LEVAGAPALVSLMAANNETGVLQPVSQAAALVHAAGGRLHVDAVQAAGRIPLDINEIGADLMTVSSHKIGGPQGAGALVRSSQAVPLQPMIRGGGQERGARAGTENVAGIAGFGAAAAAAKAGLAAEAAQMEALRNRLERGLRAISPEAIVFGQNIPRLPNTTLFAVPEMKSETAVIAFDLAGVAVSSGAACSSGKVTPSHVLAAMGVPPPLARGAVRISLGPTTTESDVDRCLEAWRKLAQSLTVRRNIAA
jgi:cysteine desulfurase